MVVMYPLQAQADYTELRYSLRSLVNLTEQLEVVIVADYLPDWVTGVTWIKVKDVPGRKQLSIRRKILAALEYHPELFFMNDDVYLLKPTDPFNHPYYSHGLLKNYSESGARHLEKQLPDGAVHFDGHYPLVYNRERFYELSDYHQDSIIKSMYCNHHGIEGGEAADCKIFKKSTDKYIQSIFALGSCVSTGPSGLAKSLPFLKQKFPKKSDYETW